MHDEWIYLTGEKLAADGIGEAECASGYAPTITSSSA